MAYRDYFAMSGKLIRRGDRAEVLRIVHWCHLKLALLVGIDGVC